MDTVAIRDVLFEQQQGKCFWCGGTMHNDRAHQNDLFASIEHILPRAFGGPNRRSNLALAHKRCNHSRNHKIKLPLYWVQQVHALLVETRGYLDGLEIANQIDSQLAVMANLNELAYRAIREDLEHL